MYQIKCIVPKVSSRIQTRQLSAAFSLRGGSALSHTPLATRSYSADTVLLEQEEVNSFSDLRDLNSLIASGVVSGMGYTNMTEVQKKVIPFLLSPETRGSNSLVQAKTGTGKTLAFMIPIVQEVYESILRSKHNHRPSPIAVIIAPTRELAYQIRDESVAISSYIRESSPEHAPIVRAVVGGVNKRTEFSNVFGKSGCHILVATPGRLLDYLRSDPSLFKYTRIKVYDEADRLLDQGFARDIASIDKALKAVTNVEQVLMFSATVRPDVAAIAQRELGKEYLFVKTSKDDESPTHLKIPQTIISVDKIGDHIEPLISLLKYHSQRIEDGEPFKAIVFMRTGKEVAHYYNVLSDVIKESFFKIQVSQISARMTQNKRLKALEEFKKSKNGLLIASDVVARGVDVKDVTDVFQVGAAMNVEQYIHRVGRTGRAGKSGSATVILSSREDYFLRQLRQENISFVQELEYVSDPVLYDKIRGIAQATMERSNRNYIKNVDAMMERSKKRSGKPPVIEQPNMDVSSTLLAMLGYYIGTLKSKGGPAYYADLFRELFESAGPLLGHPTGAPLTLSARQISILRKIAKLSAHDIKSFAIVK